MIDEAFAVDLSSPGARRLFEYWVHGEGAARIRWGTDGSFARCERHLTGKVRDPQGLCAEYHKAATGEWPAEKGIQSAVGNVPRLRWRGLLGLIGTPTGDKRKILDGALTTRNLPLPLLWQRKTVSGKHDGSVVIGLIDKVDITSHTIYGEGDLFTPDPKIMPRLAEDVAELRYITEQGLGGPSIDIQLDDLTYEYRGDELVVVSGRLAAATLVQVPAFAETKGAFEIYEEGVLVASVGVMRPFELITIEEWEESKHPRDAEGKFKEKPGGDLPGGVPGPAGSEPPLGIGRNRIGELISSFTNENEFGFHIRDSLATRTTTRQVSDALSDDLRKIFGRNVYVDFGNSDTDSAMEHAEGILRVMEIFPRSQLFEVSMFSADNSTFAHATYQGEIQFNGNWSDRFKRSLYLASLKTSTATKWHPPGGESPATVAIHEAIHNVHQTILGFVSEETYPLLSKRIMQSIDPAMDLDRGQYGISIYADKTTMEMVAEAATDVITNGDNAADNSKKVFRILVQEYERFHKQEVVSPKPRPESPQEATARKAKKAIASVLEQRDATVLKKMSRAELKDAAEKLDVPLEPGMSDEHIRVVLVTDERVRRNRKLPAQEANLRQIDAFVDRLVVRQRNTASDVLDKDMWPIQEVARALNIPTKRNESREDIKNRILDHLFGSTEKPTAPEDGDIKRVTATNVKVGDEVRADDFRGINDKKMHKVARIEKNRGRLRLLDKDGRTIKESLSPNSKVDMRPGKAEAPKPTPKPKPGIDEPRYFRKRAGVGVAFNWFYEFNGETHGPFTQKVVAQADFEERQNGKRGIGLKETDLQQFQKDLQARVDRSSVSEVAQKLGVSTSSIRNWIKGSKPRNLEVVSRALKEALGPDAPVIDIDTAKVDSALDEIFEARNPNPLRALDTASLRLVAKDRGIKLRANASRDSLIMALYDKRRGGRLDKPGYGNSVDLIYATSRPNGRKMLEGLDTDDLLGILEETGVDDRTLLDAPPEVLIRRILGEIHRRKPSPRPGLRPEGSGAAPFASNVPTNSREFYTNVDGIEDIVEKVDTQLDQAESKKIVAGQQGGLKEELTFPDGSKLFGKGFPKIDEYGDPFNARTIADREQLGSRLGQALQAPVPRVYRQGEQQVYAEWIDGSMTATLAETDLDQYQRMMLSKRAARLGLLDILSANTDRHDANMIVKDKKLSGVDNGLMWSGVTQFWDDKTDAQKAQNITSFQQGPARRFVHAHGNPGGAPGLFPDNPMTPGDVQLVRAKLRELEDEFDHLGRRDWWRYSNDVLDLIEPHAKGKSSIFSDIEDATFERERFTEPGDAGEYHVNLSGIEDMAENLKLINNENIRRGRVIQGGMGGRQERIFFPDGSSMFVKDYGLPIDDDDQDGIRATIDREQLGAAVGQALGANIPRAVRDREGRIATEWVDGKPVAFLREDAKESDDWSAYWEVHNQLSGHDGRLIGLVDVLTGNHDRHDLNLVRGNDGRLYGVDQGEAWKNPEAFFDRDDPEDRFINVIAQTHAEGPSIIDYNGQSLLTEGDVTEIRRRLEALRPDFERLGRERWLEYSLAVLDDLDLIKKDGAKSIFDPNWDEDD